MINQYAIEHYSVIYCVEIDEEVGKVVLASADNSFINIMGEENKDLRDKAIAYYKQGILTPIERTWITKEKLAAYSETAFKAWIEGTRAYFILRNSYLLDKYETPFYETNVKWAEDYYPHWSFYLLPRIKGFTATTIEYDSPGAGWMSRSEAIDLAITEWEAIQQD